MAAAICMLIAASLGLDARASVDSRDRTTSPFGEEPITPVPSAASLEADKVRLGEMLFHDVRLSRGDVLACASCHLLAEGGDDNRARSPGVDGELLDFNAPTVFNAALSFRLNWRGNFRTLEAQIEAVLLDPDLMNTTWEELLAKLRADQAYRKAFSAAYGSDPAPAHVLDASPPSSVPCLPPTHASTGICAARAMRSEPKKSTDTSCSRPTAASPVTRASTWAATCSRNSGSSTTPSHHAAP
jgi:cytochrome c peroxidase